MALNSERTTAAKITNGNDRMKVRNSCTKIRVRLEFVIKSCIEKGLLSPELKFSRRDSNPYSGT